MSAIFSDITTPYINQVTLNRRQSPEVKKNIFQSIFTKPNEAVTEKYTTDTDAAEIQIIRVKPQENDGRDIGATVNGGYFNSNDASQPTTAAYPIRILTTIDKNEDIPTNMQDMVSVDLAAATLENLSGRVARNVNAMTIAAQLAKNLSDIAAGKIESNIVTLGSGTSAYKDALIAAGVKLDDGNEDEGIDTYPSDQRAVFVRSSYKTNLYNSGSLIIGGSNYAQDILRKGGLDSDTRPNNITAYLGEIDNMPVYLAASSVWTLAEQYAGVPKGAFAKVQAVVVSGLGTGRGLAFNAAIKTIPSPAGQGIRIQPKYRMGAECFDALSVVPIVSSGFVNPATAAHALTLVGPTSRNTTAISLAVTADSVTLTPTGNAFAGGDGAMTITVPTGAWYVLFNATTGAIISDLTSVAAGTYGLYVLATGYVGNAYTVTLS